ncbi:MAG TPA: molybdate ABC transporter permease subunit [Candidatus Latescibacteria bacterium]|jgi:molybdate transport system permease protein|nr:molybdate ABC transporter permease subunit [Gemmatimonadota bacterium]MDP7361828.1 molybdate ABC transporter permease subunit [Candidatus Latescibacterota bacterium]MBU06473.1 molybdate ABC transporter permease subunit [Gemmatimonadota bacterium]MDP7633237.1 molybdate ABC transporter permease subunit [Candidatus Latescibacterota bacterium]MEC8932386.1 molybdate ABC transporter permease subunit [Candidatus Latescibacterota bacterium]|tara:strand:+ start:72 stop:722 length:651 start_codon:yes stop_codon:yes gene_type:complete
MIDPLWLSLKVTAVAAILIFTIGTALALWLVRHQPRGRTVIETLIMLPLVLPPSVVGYYLLIVLGQQGPIVGWLGIQTLFSPAAAIIAATVVGLPLMVQAARAALASVDPALEQAARTLGCNEAMVLWRVSLPLARRGLLAGLVLGTTRALGEFGATLMVAGNIPGQTQTLPLAIYDAVQTNQHDLTTQMVLLMTGLGFVSLWAVRRWEPSVGRAK